MLDDAMLLEELAALGVERDLGPDDIDRARTLFARAVEAPGGLKIQTIHSFCASGGDAKLNAQMLTDALGGEKGPVADCLMLNAGVAMAAADQAASMEEGVAMCKEAHAQGRAGDTLRNWIELSQKLRAQEA